MNEFYTISIIKLWDAKFVMYIKLQRKKDLQKHWT
jgi:hypothetical protein